MSDYDFTALSAGEFEALVHDLMQPHLGVSLEIFKTGRDNGIDLRYSKPKDNSLIIQCKHYAIAGFNSLLSHIKNEEVTKVKQLSPERYILVTSVALSPANKVRIRALLTPYCRTAGDIIGNGELNALLRDHSDIERAHYKLWLSSTTVLESIVKARILNATQAELDHIRNKIRLYVQNDSFQRALDILEREHYCIIAGIPGIGKTTLAEALIMHYIGHDFQVIKVSEDIEEANELYHPAKTQIIYYDDFLGQTSFGQKLGKNEDANLLRFIENVRRAKNSRLILTTREYILSDAKVGYERLNRSNFDVNKCIVSVDDYTRLIKAKILYNHLYFSKLAKGFIENILNEERYMQIVDHKNYNPRLVESMTSTERMSGITPSRYFAYFKATLDNPVELWGHPFEYQLSDASRHLLLVLVSLPPRVGFEDLHKAFDLFHFHQSEKYKTPIAQHDFRNALRQLEGTFTQTDRSMGTQIINFHNPSVRDYLEQVALWEEGIAAELCDSFLYFEQCSMIWTIFHSEHDRKIRLVEKCSVNYLNAIRRTYSKGGCEHIRSIRKSVPNGYLFSESNSRGDTIEDRVVFVVNVANTLGTVDSKSIVNEMLLTIEERLQNNIGDRPSLVRLLLSQTILSYNYGFPSDDFIQLTKSFLLYEPDALDDYEAIAKFVENYPGILSDDDLEEVCEMYYSSVGWYVSNATDSDDLAEISGYIEQIGYIGEIIGANVNDELSEMHSRKRDVERELDLQEDAYEYSSQRLDTVPSSARNEDYFIHSLFEGLHSIEE